MKYGFVPPCGDARTAAELAARAEFAGWDGFFVSEPVWGIDTWISLAAAAMRTEHIRLGTMITPLSRMSPWKLASETATLDNLSNGRVILSVGLGAIDTGFEAFGEVTDRSMRAELLDEGLDILIGLWRGQPFNYDGKHYKVRETNFYPPPPPVQKPRIPIWVVGAWPSEKFIRRALRYDGLFPQELKPIEGTRHNARQAMPDTLRQMKVFVEARRAETTPFDIAVEGETPGGDPEQAAAVVREWAEAGATWWIEANWSALDQSDGIDAVTRRIALGPPGE